MAQCTGAKLRVTFFLLFSSIDKISKCDMAVFISKIVNRTKIWIAAQSISTNEKNQHTQNESYILLSLTVLIHVLRMRLLLAFFVMLKIEVDESESLSIGQRRSEKTVVIKLSREKVRDFSRKAYWSEVCRQNPSLLFIDVIQRLSMAYIIGRNE